jgi:hypothetical protein
MQHGANLPAIYLFFKTRTEGHYSTSSAPPYERFSRAARTVMFQVHCHLPTHHETRVTRQKMGTGMETSHGQIPPYQPPQLTFLGGPREIRLLIYEYLLVSSTGHVTIGVRDHNRRECLEDWKWHLLHHSNKDFRFQALLE